MSSVERRPSQFLLLSALFISAFATKAFASVGTDEAHLLLNDWQLEEAMTLAERLLAEDPNNPDLLVLAARVQLFRGEHLSSLALLDAYAAIEPEMTVGFRERVESSARYAHLFETRETAHFKIRYLNKDEITATYAEPVLEAAYRNIAGDLELFPAERGEKIVVEIYPDARGLAGATGLTIQEIETSGTIAVCKFHRLMITSPLATANGYSWGDTLAHEFAHLVISKKSHNSIPIWLHEGIAKYFESRWKGDLGMALSPFGENLLAEAVRTQDYITFEQMHPSMAKLPSQEDASLAFAEVFTVIEYLVQRFGKASIAKLLDHSAGGDRLESSLQAVFGMKLHEIEKSWKQYLAKRPFRKTPGATARKIRLATNETEAQADKPLETIDDQEVHNFSRLGELLQLRKHHQAAIIEYEKAFKKSGVRYATLVNRLAHAYVAVNRKKEAAALLDKLFVAHPSDSDAHLLAGRIALETKNLRNARTHFEAVRLENPFNPEIHLMLSRLHKADGNESEAELEKHFFTLSRKPRPSRKYELPTPPAGTSKISIVAAGWRPIRIDGGLPIVTPAWNYPIEPGDHSVEFLNKDGTTSLKSFSIKSGESQTLLLH